MTDVQGLTRALTELKPSRRTVLVAAAWTAPAVMGLSAVPAVAASGGDDEPTGWPTELPTGAKYAVWARTQGKLDPDQLGKTGWTHSPKIAISGPNATASDWLDLGTLDPGFLSERDAVDPGAEVTVTFAYPSIAEKMYALEIPVVSRAGAQAQLLDVKIDGFGLTRSFRLSAGSGAPEDYLPVTQRSRDADGYRDDGTAPILAGGVAASDYVTVTLTFTLPAGESGDFWIGQPDVGMQYG